MENNYKYFCNKDCRYYPCHEIPEGSEFNCLFCFCPLHGLGDKCGGNYQMISNGTIKDCSNCIFPHLPESYDVIIQKLSRK